MSNNRRMLAKLTRPRMHGAIARERLFARLDEARWKQPAICVVGPPGAGKTTLAASWLDSRGIAGIWYQVDPGDADLATFFHYLGEAGKPFTRKGQRPLPALTPEYLQDVPGFARRFFRDLFARLPDAAVVVLDNYQEVAPDQVFHQLVADAVTEVPQGQTLLAVSRQDPPDCYARLIASEGVAFIEWDDLKLSLEEAHAIARARGQDDATLVRALHAQCAGWVTGLTLMLERPRGTGTSVEEASREALFRYFATLIFERSDVQVQRFLVATAYLPTVAVSVAAQLTGNALAGRILEDLYRRHLFTHRRPGGEPSYWYHALFRQFLMMQGQRLLSGEEQAQLKQRAARLLDAAGQFEEAFQLFGESEDWEGALRLVLSRAAELLKRGRGRTLRDWIDALPRHLVTDHPWLDYWYGTSLIAIDHGAARDYLQRSFGRFGTLGERRWQCLAAAGVIDTHFFEWSDFRPVRRWAAVLGELIESVPMFESKQVELKVYSSWLLAMVYGEPGHPECRRCADHVEQMLDQEIDLDTRMTAAVFLLSFATLAVDLDRGRRVVDRFGGLIDDPHVSPLHQRWWYTRLGYFLWNEADHQGAWEALEKSHRIAELHGLQGLRQAAVLALNYQMHAALSMRNWRAAQQVYERMLVLADPGRAMWQWHDLWVRTQLAGLHGDPPIDDETYECLLQAAQDTGMVYVQILSRLAWAQKLAPHGRGDRLAELLREARALCAGTVFAYLESELTLVDALAAIQSRENGGRAALASALQAAKRTGYPYPTRTYSRFLAQLCTCALAAGIEIEYVRVLVRKFNLEAPSQASEAWPWPVKVFTLRPFEVHVEGAPLRFEGKTPRKQLSLLKAIIALGGRDVPATRLVDLLWGDWDGDGGGKALGVALLRLRKLLGHHEALVVADERVTLNPDLVWTDARAFERLVAQIDAQLLDAQLARAPQALEQVLSLYQSNFLASDGDETWAVKYRLRLRGMLARVVENIGAQLEEAAQWDQARACYQRGIEADELVEEFYLGLMRCYRALGRPAEGVAVFRRLRQTLSVVLGVAPSRGAETLLQSLREAGVAAPSP